MSNLLNLWFDTERFILCIRERPALWDSGQTDYTNPQVRTNLWSEICAIMFDEFDGLPPMEQEKRREEIKMKWKNLRTCYKREIKRRKNPKSGVRKVYIYYDLMTFLKPVSNSMERDSDQEEVAELPTAVVIKQEEETSSIAEENTPVRIKRADSLEILDELLEDMNDECRQEEDDEDRTNTSTGNDSEAEDEVSPLLSVEEATTQSSKRPHPYAPSNSVTPLKQARMRQDEESVTPAGASKSIPPQLNVAASTISSKSAPRLQPSEKCTRASSWPSAQTLQLKGFPNSVSKQRPQQQDNDPADTRVSLSTRETIPKIVNKPFSLQKHHTNRAWHPPPKEQPTQEEIEADKYFLLSCHSHFVSIPKALKLRARSEILMILEKYNNYNNH